MPLRAGLMKKNRVLRCVSKWFLSSFPAESLRGIFLMHLLWEPGQAPQGKSHNIMEFLTLRVVPPEPPATYQLQFKTSYLNSFPGWCLWRVSALVSWGFLCLLVCLYSLRCSTSSPVLSSLLLGSKNIFFYFSVCSAFIVTSRIQWWLPTSSYVRTGNWKPWTLFFRSRVGYRKKLFRNFRVAIYPLYLSYQHFPL